MKTLNDFLWWLETAGCLNLYWQHVRECLTNNHLLMSDFIKGMDANNIGTLFLPPMIEGFWGDIIAKYETWMIHE